MFQRSEDKRIRVIMVMRKLRKFIICISALIILCAGCRSGLPVSAPPLEQVPVLHQDYLKSAHYFGDGWAVNFWNCELDRINQQLDRIAADGFNSIILVLPWREFQPEIRGGQLNDYAADQLRLVLEKAGERNLGVMLRMGYTWDYYEADSVLPRYYSLMGDPAYEDAWLSYLDQVYRIASAYDCFLGGFLCWEDFWNYTYTAKALGAEKLGAEEGAFIGYHRYLEERYPLEQVNEWYGENFTDYSQVWFPSQESPALKLFFDFYDDYLNRLLAESQNVFPNLSMEVRLDADLAADRKGNSYYYGHEATYGCQTADYTAVMYGIPMGFANQGERVSCEEAMAMTGTILSGLLEKNQGKDVYIDQFLYADNTPGYENNAQIREDQLNDYLERVHPILAEKTMGYGVWTYQDYGVDLLYNPQFALGLAGWETEGEVRAAKENGSMQARLEAGALIRQNIPPGRKTDTGEERIYVTGQYSCESETALTVTLGQEEPVTVSCKPGRNVSWQLDFSNTKDYTLTIQSGGTVYIDNLKVYAHVQNGMLYDMDGREGGCIKSLRMLNRELGR